MLRRGTEAGAAAAFAAAILALVAALAGAAAAAAAPAAPLGHEGRWITDAAGRVVVLHGWNMVNKLPPYHPAALGFGRDDARFLAEQGFNTVRLGIIHKGLEPDPGSYDERYLDRIERTARILAEEGLFVLLDFHQDMYNERFNGEGEPDWSVIGDAATLPAEPDNGFPANYFGMPAVSRAYDNFLANLAGPGGVGLQDRFAAAWAHVAERFRGEERVFGYNIFNEPWPGSSWESCANPAGCPGPDVLLTAFHQRVIAAIREADPEQMVWYAPYLWFDFGARTHHGDTGDANAGFAFNMYCLAFAAEIIAPDFPSGGEEFCDEEYEIVLGNAEAQSQATGDALLMTEYAATRDLRTIHEVTTLADEKMVSWQQWAYFNEDPCCERPIEGLIREPGEPPSGLNIRRAKLRASARPYPQLVAGTPESWSFDRGSGVFRLEYSTTGPGGDDFSGRAGRSEVHLPRHHFHAYETELSGAAVRSDPQAELLRLRNDPGAGRVELVVRPLCSSRTVGTASPDRLVGGGESDWIVGRGGGDRITGGDGADCLYGRKGADRIGAGPGDDLLFGGRGRDRLEPGAGSDQVRGRRGDDLIDAQDGEADEIRCGLGEDEALVDEFDSHRGCEAVALAIA